MVTAGDHARLRLQSRQLPRWGSDGQRLLEELEQLRQRDSK